MIDKKKVIDFHKEGLSASEIARRLGVHRGSVHYFFKEVGLKPNIQPRRKWDTSQVADLLSEGYSVKKIAEKLGTSIYAIYRYLEERK